jgi:hypothetical protein
MAPTYWEVRSSPAVPTSPGRLHVDRRLIRVRADSLGKAERQNQRYEERCSGIVRNQRNAASGEKKTQGSQDQRITYAFHPSASESGESRKGGHG